VIRRMRCAGLVALVVEIRNTYKISVGNPKWKRPLRRPSRRWEDHIKVDLRKIGWKGVDWMHLDQGS
jgi:hypothetical protein